MGQNTVCPSVFFSIAVLSRGSRPTGYRRGRMDLPNPKGFTFAALGSRAMTRPIGRTREDTKPELSGTTSNALSDPLERPWAPLFSPGVHQPSLYLTPTCPALALAAFSSAIACPNTASPGAKSSIARNRPFDVLACVPETTVVHFRLQNRVKGSTFRDINRRTLSTSPGAVPGRIFVLQFVDLLKPSNWLEYCSPHLAAFPDN